MIPTNNLWARLITLSPEDKDIHLSSNPDQANEYNSNNNEWRIYQEPKEDTTWIENISVSSIKIDDSQLEPNQKKELQGGEKISFESKPDKSHYYVFVLISSQAAKNDLKRPRREDQDLPENLPLITDPSHRLKKMENDLQEELLCSICMEILYKSATLSPCQHSFCSGCLINYFKHSIQCPLCKEKILSVKKNPILHNVIELNLKNFPNLQQQRPQDNQEEEEEMELAGKVVQYSNGVFIGRLINGSKEGPGRLIYTDGSIYTGNWTLDRIQNYGIMKYANSAIYKGQWQNGRKHGKGVFIHPKGSSYDGDWVDEEFHGFGKYIWSNGEEYEGDWENGKVTGNGILRYVDGRVYQGQFKRNDRDGMGILTMENGDSYEGNWVRDTIQNPVKILYHDGDKYEGEIEDDNYWKEGKGVMTFSNGDVYDGEWKSDNQNGKGKYMWSLDNRVYEGWWKFGEMDGNGCMNYESGWCYQGRWRRNRKEDGKFVLKKERAHSKYDLR